MKKTDNTPNPDLLPAENLTIARIRKKAAEYELRLLRAAEKAGKIPNSQTVLQRMLNRLFFSHFK